MIEGYTTKFWNNTHPVIPVLNEIKNRYFPSGTSKLYLSRVKAANPKIKLLRELIHKHYRLYNDGDSFRIGGFKAQSSSKYNRQAEKYFRITDREVEESNHALHLIEDKISNLTMQIAALTREERSRLTDQYGRVHRALPEHLGF